MTDKQLPTLKPGDSHMESLIEAAIQGNADTRDAMRWLVRQLVPVMQPAEVTDSMIREAFLTNGFTIKDGHSDLKPYVYAAARAILALRPVRVPMKDEQLRDCLRSCQHDTVENLRVRWLYAKEFARAIEAHHGITAQVKKEKP